MLKYFIFLESNIYQWLLFDQHSELGKTLQLVLLIFTENPTVPVIELGVEHIKLRNTGYDTVLMVFID